MNIADRIKQTFAGKRASIPFTGDFKSWDEAQKESAGYDAPQILEKTRAALLKVKAGRAAFGRDSMAFETMEYDFSLLAGLLRAAAADCGRLSVLDFGGSLGGTYFQSRTFLSPIDVLRWRVVDQPGHVACGKADFANDELHFYPIIDDCLRTETPNVLLLSGVIQYLREPYAFLENSLRAEIPYVIVERTAFNQAGRDRLTIRHVPPWLYDASYPAWFLSEATFRKVFDEKYDLICAYVSAEEAHPEGGRPCLRAFISSGKPQNVDRT